jgi:hypothetical protein
LCDTQKYACCSGEHGNYLQLQIRNSRKQIEGEYLHCDDQWFGSNKIGGDKLTNEMIQGTMG